MQQNLAPKFIATPHAITIDGMPLNKSTSRKLPPETLRYIKRAEELLATVKKEDWDNRTPHATNDVPAIAKAQMMLALASPQVFGKYNHNHRGPGPGGGQFTTADSDGVTSADLKNPRFKGMSPLEIKKQKFVDAHLAATESAARQYKKTSFMSKLSRVLAIASLMLACTANAKEVSEKVDIDSGSNLVKLAIAGTDYQGSGFGVPNKYNREKFLIYQILAKYEGTAAWLAVNPWTGDVWDMNECKLVSNPALQKAQAKIKKQFTTNELKEYEQLHSIKPYREYDLEPCP